MTRSDDLFKRAQDVIPGGVNSPVRAFRAVGGTPRFIASASGARALDAGFRPGMGNVVPDRFFWALPAGEEGEEGKDGGEPGADDATTPKNPRHVH